MKIKNKFISFVLAVFIIFGIMSAPVTVYANMYGEIYINDNFITGKIPSGYSYTEAGGHIRVVNQALRFERTDPTEPSATTMDRLPSGLGKTGKIVYELTSVKRSPGLIHVHFRGMGGIALSLKFYDDNKIAFGYGIKDENDILTMKDDKLMSYSLDVPTTIRLLLDTETSNISVWGDNGSGEKLILDNVHARTEDVVNAWNTSFIADGMTTPAFDIVEFKMYSADLTLTSEDALNVAYENLTFDSLSTQAIDDVSDNLYLPSKGLYDTEITWSSSNTDVISDTGIVTRGTNPEADDKVTLTATLELDGVKMTKEFDITVVRQLEGNAAVNKAYEALDVSDLTHEPYYSITKQLNLPDKFYGADVVWISNRPDIISPDGTVNRPTAQNGDTEVVLTTIISNGDYTLSKDLNVNVLAQTNFTDPYHISDTDFFGKWDADNECWAVEGKINYSYSPKLSAAEECVKAGDYTGAKNALWEYYKQRTKPILQPGKRNQMIANLNADDIYSFDIKYLLTEFTVTPQWKECAINVDAGSISKGGYTSFMIMGRKKDDGIGEFYSRENDEHVPVIEVVVNGDVKTFTAVDDCYTRAGTYGNEIHGTEPTLLVKDSGAPFDDESRRAFIKFDFSSIKQSDVVTKATLKIYGRSDVDTPKSMLLTLEPDNTWKEHSRNWNNTVGNVYSWSGIEGGTDFNPVLGSEREFYYFVCRFIMLEYVVYEYLLGHDEYYGYKIVERLMDFIHDKGLANTGAGYPRSLETAIRTRYLIMAYLATVNSPSMEVDANTAILKYMWMHGYYLSQEGNFHSHNNWGGSEAAGLYYTLLYFPEFKDGYDPEGIRDTWETTVVDRFKGMMANLQLDDGSYIEATSGYSEGQLNTYLGYRSLAFENGRELGEEFDEMLSKLGYYTLDCFSPSGYGAMYGDADYSKRSSGHKTVLVELLNDPVMEYIDTFGASGVEPDYTSVLYPDAKISIMRSGWNKNGLYLFTNARGGLGGHGHADDLSLTVAAYDQLLLVDPGRYTYDQAPERAWLVSTKAHNTVGINDRSQAIEKQEGTIEDWVSNNSFDFSRMSTPNTGGFKHTRNVFFVRPNYWIVSDFVEPEGANFNETNNYKQLWHFLPNANLALDNVSNKLYSNFEIGANIDVISADSDITANIEDGYYSPAYLTLSDAKYGYFEKNTAGNATFDTVLYPIAEDSNETVGVERIELDITPDIATAMKIYIVDEEHQHLANTGYYYLTQKDSYKAERDFDKYRTDAALAYVQHEANGNLKEVSVKNGNFIKDNTTDEIIISGENLDDVGISYQSNTIKINSSNDNFNLDTFKFKANSNVEHVYLNDEEIGFNFDNGMISFASSSIIDKNPAEGSGGSSTPGNIGNSGSGGGGGSAGGSVTQPSTPPVEKETLFDDTEGHWAQQYVEKLASLNIVNGTGDREFSPEDNVTRAQFAAMVVRALKLSASEYDNIFSDVSADDWYAEAVQTAFEHGLINGYDGKFSPNEQITREQAAKIIVSAYEKAYGEITDLKLCNFTDSKSISDWAKAYIERSVTAGLIVGFEDGNFYPQRNASRAEAAVMIYRMLAADTQEGDSK